MKLGLFGFPLGHSFSKGIFEKIFEQEEQKSSFYIVLEEEDPMNIIQRANENGLKGFNVTIPHKESIIPFLDQIDKNAQNPQTNNNGCTGHQKPAQKGKILARY